LSEEGLTLATFRVLPMSDLSEHEKDEPPAVTQIIDEAALDAIAATLEGVADRLRREAALTDRPSEGSR